MKTTIYFNYLEFFIEFKLERFLQISIWIKITSLGGNSLGGSILLKYVSPKKLYFRLISARLTNVQVKIYKYLLI